MNDYIHYIKRLVEKGGPDPSEYDAVTFLIRDVANQVRAGKVRKEELKAIRMAFGKAFSTATMQGFAYTKPHGYAGDFEIIHRIYQEWLSPDPHLVKWDYYFHAQAAPRAVRNRKQYFKDLMKYLENNNEGSGIQVLNVGSGPCDDVCEYLNENNKSKIFFECVDQDSRAIDFAQTMCRKYLHQIHFHNQNIIKFSPDKQFDLIWSAGLFDYVNDKAFKALLKCLYSALRKGGELVVGNFSHNNPTRDYMEILGGWVLIYRSTEELRSLARSIGIENSRIKIYKETEGVNLFLHIKA
ncbi:MAG TPA: class I SAM-dependent methyltransferase [Candidatus Wunengus sp. YC63]|uniref:class I SAM-dependent methyltransferase n=1 Tax=Candidatus Wunengus sp. YC63 TaxID=3367699 RepID=UPI004027C849